MGGAKDVHDDHRRRRLMADHAKDVHDDHAPHEVRCSTCPISPYFVKESILYSAELVWRIYQFNSIMLMLIHISRLGCRATACNSSL
jgi:hypothetical protein